MPKVQNGPFVGDATVVLKDGSAQDLDGTTGIFFLERYDVIDYLIFEMVNNQNENNQPAPIAVKLGENPVLKISVDDVLCEYGKIEYADETKTKIKITPSSEAMATLDKLGYFAFNVPENTITDEAGNPVRSMDGNYISGTLNSPLLKVADSTKPFVEAIKAILNTNPETEVKATGMPLTLVLNKDTLTTQIVVDLNENVTFKNGAMSDEGAVVTISGEGIPEGTIYGKIYREASVENQLIIVPDGTNGIAGLAGLFTFKVAPDTVFDSSNNGNAETSFTLEVVDPVV